MEVVSIGAHDLTFFSVEERSTPGLTAAKDHAPLFLVCNASHIICHSEIFIVLPGLGAMQGAMITKACISWTYWDHSRVACMD